MSQKLLLVLMSILSITACEPPKKTGDELMRVGKLLEACRNNVKPGAIEFCTEQWADEWITAYQGSCGKSSDTVVVDKCATENLASKCIRDKGNFNGHSVRVEYYYLPQNKTTLEDRKRFCEEHGTFILVNSSL